MTGRFTANTVCRIVASVLQEQGAESVVCSPGSRNAPLLLAFDEQTQMSKFNIIDERSAAFFALGRSLVKRKPVVLVCTSGTALLNYAPAIAEAYYQGVPLIVVSADRPEQWIDQDDSQTLHQYEALANHVKGSYDIPAFESEEILWMTNRIVNEAYLRATIGRPGPVHINVRIDTPIGRLTSAPLPEQRLITPIFPSDTLTTAEILSLAEEIADKKVLVVLGFMQSDSKISKAASALSRLPNVFVMHETIANVHAAPQGASIDMMLGEASKKELDKLSPDVVITAGGALVSRKVKEFLREAEKYNATQHWSVGESHCIADCFKALTYSIAANPGAFLNRLAGSIGKLQSQIQNKNHVSFHYRDAWMWLSQRAYESHEKFCKNVNWSSLAAFASLMPVIPRQCNLMLSNGTAIRYAQLFARHAPHASFCNRGVSGIDGQLAAACGLASGYENDTVFITGDMSMAHDIGALQIACRLPKLKIIVLNNQGGEIFRFIKATSRLPQREQYLAFSPDIPLKALSESYGYKYFFADSETALKKELTTFFDHRHQPCLLEIKVPCDSAEVLKQYFKRNN